MAVSSPPTSGWHGRAWLVGLVLLLVGMGAGALGAHHLAPPLPPPPSTDHALAPPAASATALQATATPQPTAARPRHYSEHLRRRPYSDTSAWNQPIGDQPVYDRRSEELIATIGRSKTDGVITSDASQYSYPVYFVDRDTPRWDVPCRKYACTIVTTSGATTTAVLRDVPIPERAQPSSGTDGNMIIVDLATGTEYNFWQMRRRAQGWEASNGSIYNITWDGMPPTYGSRGAGLPYLGGLIRPWEIRQGRIEHAIAFGYPFPARDKCVYPASKTDGNSKRRDAIPEGARLQLDPTLTEADFARMGLDRTGMIIARALQEYGMILVDFSERPKIYVENLADNPYATEQWDDPELQLHAETIAAIPYTAFRVLELPAAYWDRSVKARFHGECYMAEP